VSTADPSGLQGRVAVVTGASRGIGLAIVQALVARGAHVVAGASSSSPGLVELGDAVETVLVDLSTPDGPAELVARAGARLDILVNNVGGAPARPGGFLSITDADWDRTFTLNLMAAVRATRSALPLMLAAGSGAIVNTCSVNAVLPDPAVLDYSASKAALLNFSKSLSKELGRNGIRINTVSPGPVATDLWLGAGGVAETFSAASGKTPDEVAKGAAAGASTGRFSTPGEVAALVAFLAGDEAANITGSDFVIDGGLIPTI
jgi:NAD(P)-dependent dehydrogenase (short-subunit alcohol dehydrogenase family)